MKRLLIYLGIPIALFLVIGLLFSSRPTEKSYVYSDIVNYFEDQQVTAFSINMGTGAQRREQDDHQLYGAEFDLSVAGNSALCG